jgi:hypothetical protein
MWEGDGEEADGGVVDVFKSLQEENLNETNRRYWSTLQPSHRCSLGALACQYQRESLLMSTLVSLPYLFYSRIPSWDMTSRPAKEGNNLPA